jgi:membrane protein
MPWRYDWRRLTRFDCDPTHWAHATLQVGLRAWHRSQGRDAMLYIGGVCFAALLAVFPALAILIGIYSVIFSPAEAVEQAEFFTRALPPHAEGLFQRELQRLTSAPVRIVSVQSAIAILIGLYASQKGVKALLAGLALIHDEERPRSFLLFNLFAFGVAIGLFALAVLVSSTFLTVRVMGATFSLTPLKGLWWVFSEWTWATLGLMVAYTLIYRWGMSRRPVAWRASLTGGAVATALSLGASWLCAFYVQQLPGLGATYGSIAAVVIFLIWLSWNVNGVFYGAALATELEIILGKRHIPQLEDLRNRRVRTQPVSQTPAPDRRQAPRATAGQAGGAEAARRSGP